MTFLSQAQVDVLIKQPGYHSDGNRLYINVRANGSWSWFLQFRLNGKERGTGLGRCSLFEARQKASQVLLAVKSGIDPVEKNRESLQSKEHQSAMKERRLQQGRDYKSRNKDAVTAQVRLYRSSPEVVAKNAALSHERWQRNREDSRAQNNERTKVYAERLDDWYVKRLLAPQIGVKHCEIPPRLIELKRQSVAIRRMSRGLKRHIKTLKRDQDERTSN